VNELGEPVKSHWHLLCEFGNSRDLPTVRNYFADYALTDEQEAEEKKRLELALVLDPPAEYANKLRLNSFEKGISKRGLKRYLVHADDKSKYQYNPEQVETNDVLYLDLFIPQKAKQLDTKYIIEGMADGTNCKSWLEFISLFEQQMYSMNSYNRISIVMSLRRYYNEYHKEFSEAEKYDKEFEKDEHGNMKVNLDGPLPF
jgi:hypothetical protein